MDNKEIVISEGERPWWMRLIAAFFYTGMVGCLYYFLMDFDIFGPEEDLARSLSFLKFAGILFSGGIGFSLVRDYHFDFQAKRYKILFCVGPVKIGRWRNFYNLEYISVFKNGINNFEVNLWYNRNRHFNIFSYGDPEEALFIGKQLAQKLNIDLFDATVPHDSKWMDKNP